MICLRSLDPQGETVDGQGLGPVISDASVGPNPPDLQTIRELNGTWLTDESGYEAVSSFQPRDFALLTLLAQEGLAIEYDIYGSTTIPKTAAHKVQKKIVVQQPVAIKIAMIYQAALFIVVVVLLYISVYISVRIVLSYSFSN